MSRLAAIDIGTNSVRLLVADVEGSGRDAVLAPLERRMRITRLGQGVDASRSLAQASTTFFTLSSVPR